MVTNYAGFQYKDPNGNVLGTADPSRNYKGVMFVLTKTLSQPVAGAVLLRLLEVGGQRRQRRALGFGGNDVPQPEHRARQRVRTSWSTNRPHEFKLMGGYTIPKAEVALNAYYRAIIGANYTPVANVSGSSSVLNWTGSLNVNLEPRGSQRFETQHLVDLKVEEASKSTSIGSGVLFDIANLFNNDTITNVQTRMPDRAITYFERRTGDLDLAAGEVQVAERHWWSPIEMTFGVRWSF